MRRKRLGFERSHCFSNKENEETSILDMTPSQGETSFDVQYWKEV